MPVQILHSPFQRRIYRKASAFIGLLVIIGLVAIVFLGQWYIKKTTPDPDTSDGLMPWREWGLREANPKPEQNPSAEQPQITKILAFDTNAHLKGAREPRGEIQMTIMPDGSIGGNWGGNYYRKKVNFNGGGGFQGKIYPAKIYRDENGQDPSKLYFLAKGKFQLHESDLEKTYSIRGGDLYVKGWIDTNFQVISEILITSDEKYIETFTWSAKPIKNMFAP